MNIPRPNEFVGHPLRSLRMEQCNDVLTLGYKDGTNVYFMACQKAKGHRGRHLEKERVKDGSNTIEYSVYWRKVKDK